MKKILMMLVLWVVGMTTVNAQVYLEGSVGFTSNKYKSDAYPSTSTTSYSISPSIGYYLNEKFDIGLGLGYYGESGDVNNDYIDLTSNTFGITPFARYSFVTLGKFELLGKASAYINSHKRSWKSPNSSDKSSTNMLYCGIRLYPVVAFNLNDHITFLSTLNFASLGYNVTKDKDRSFTHSSFNFGVDSGDVANTDNFQIGFMYKF